MNRRVPSDWTFSVLYRFIFCFIYECWTHGQEFKMFESCAQEE